MVVEHRSAVAAVKRGTTVRDYKSAQTTPNSKLQTPNVPGIERLWEFGV
jgi:hypothetical protein